MSEEKHIDIHNSWRNSLDELKVLPGDPEPDLNKYWERLEPRLFVNTHNSVLHWYKLAAACMFVLLIALSVEAPSDKLIVAYQQIIIPPVRLVVEQPLSDKKESAQPIVLSKTGNRNHLPKKVISKENGKVEKVLAFEPEILVRKPEGDLPVIMAANQKQQEKPLLFRSFQKKLAVIHINELEKPVKITGDLAGGVERPAFRIRILNRDITPSPSAPAAETGNLFRIKISHQN